MPAPAETKRCIVFASAESVGETKEGAKYANIACVSGSTAPGRFLIHRGDVISFSIKKVIMV
jgi:hypothetical protein